MFFLVKLRALSLQLYNHKNFFTGIFSKRVQNSYFSEQVSVSASDVFKEASNLAQYHFIWLQQNVYQLVKYSDLHPAFIRLGIFRAGSEQLCLVYQQNSMLRNANFFMQKSHLPKYRKTHFRMSVIFVIAKKNLMFLFNPLTINVPIIQKPTS